MSDNGPGIAPELKPRLFELFAQGARDLARAQGGLGIGLTIVRRLTEMHGGTVDVESGGAEPGTTFIVRLPRVKRAAAEPPPSEIPMSIGALRRDDARRILVVDDNEDAARSLADVIAESGHDVRVVHDGREAVDTCAAWQPELVFLDIGLPGLDGYEVASRIRSGSAGGRPRLIALTGYGGPADQAKARAAGFDEHLVKPPRLASLERVLRDLESAAR